jgi:hypothetical protein
VAEQLKQGKYCVVGSRVLEPQTISLDAASDAQQICIEFPNAECGSGIDTVPNNSLYRLNPV